MKNNSIKYSPIVKALCFALSVIMFGVFIFNSVYALIPFNYLSPDEVFSDNKRDFYESDFAGGVFDTELCYLSMLFDKTAEEKEKELKSEKKKETSVILKAFIDYKISIIRDELIYVADIKDEYDDYNSEEISESYIDSIPDTPEKDRKYSIDGDLPSGVRAARKVLNYAEGEDFLKYENLIRSEAFSESFDYQSEPYGTICINLYLSKKDAEKNIKNEIDSAISARMSSYREEYEIAEKKANELENIKYCIKSEEKTLTNMSDIKKERESAESHAFYFIKAHGKTESDSLSDGRFINAENTDGYKNCTEITAYMVNENELTGNDYVIAQYNLYNQMNYSVKPYITKAVISFIASVCALVIMLNLSGHKRGFDGITLSFIDKVPGDIHFAISAAISVGCVFLFAELADELFYFENCCVIESIIQPLVLFGCALWMVFTEWIASVVRTVKSERKYFRNFIIIRVIVYIWQLIKKLFCSIRNSALRYRPKHFNKKIIAFASCYAVLSPFAVILAVSVTDDYAAGAFMAFILALAGVAAVILYRKNIKNLDRIIEASQNRESVDFGNEKLPEALSILNDSLKISNDEVRRAVESAVKNERTKAELITNVSHDLKTPLTSVISYVDLLKGCDIENEDARKYIGIIDEKADNLKMLIENLIEASKVSAGNVKLNKTMINLKELVIQSIVESGAEFESRELDLRFNENCDAVTVFADGQQTYRIIENLISNAKKYSAPCTRVYASLREENGFGVFEIKNTSKAPLDISPEELTERFVRGDTSRGEEEGNGLGLSIAKELCILQGGKLEISIDGDLFKARAYLPVQ